MKPDFSVVATWGKDRPIEELNRLIDRRIRQLNETPKDTLYAMANTVLRSLGPLMRVARPKNKQTLANSYEIQDTGLVMGRQRQPNGGWKYRPHHPGQNDYNPAIRPVVLWGGGIPSHRVRVFRVTPRFGEDRRTWAKNLHKGCWYIAAYNESAARSYTEKSLMKPAIEKYAGLARVAIAALRKSLAIGQANGEGTASERSIALAAKLAKTYFMETEGRAFLDVKSELSYGRAAMQDPSAMEYALAKAANSVAGYLRAKAKGFLDPEIETPFPEISRNGSFRR